MPDEKLKRKIQRLHCRLLPYSTTLSDHASHQGMHLQWIVYGLQWYFKQVAEEVGSFSEQRTSFSTKPLKYAF